MRTRIPKGWPKRMRDWKGRRVRARVRIRNNGGKAVAPGTLGTIRDAFRGADVAFDVCEHCGTQARISRVNPADLVLLPEGAS